jgi:hypothetical protein
MNKKTIGIIILVLIVIGGVFYFSYKQRKTEDQTKVSISTQLTGKTNNFENSELARIAKEYVLSKPRLSSDGNTNADWNKQAGLQNANLEWITSHKPSIEYVVPGKYQAPYDYLNGKYTVDWFFIPGCEENPNSTNKPNWFKNGLPCLGGYNLRVLINSDETVNGAELHALD